MVFTAPAARARLFCLLLVLPALLVLTGCPQTKKPANPLEGIERYQQDEEEEVLEPYVPRDDGVPLTESELHAFRSVGELDKGLSQEDAQTVELHFKYFVHQHRRTFERYLERTARYLPYIKKVFRERGIPEEISYLAMVESGGNPNAVSPAKAVGLWQFMPFTGKKFGLDQNSWVDERRDPFKATFAASDYLLKLYGDFGNWHLAIAAYNAGEGKIGRAVEGTGATDFFELCRLDCSLEEKARLREETRQYVPRLLAIVKIMRHLERLGFKEPSPDLAYNLEPVEVPPGTGLSSFASILGLTWDEFSAMNPAYRRTASPPHSATTAYVPPAQKGAALAWLATDDSRVYAGWREYQVRRGDSPASISKRHGISVAVLRQANGFSKLPKVGSVILIPGKGEVVEPVYDALPKAQEERSVAKYEVKSGDTLHSLAQSWGTSVENIRRTNRLGSKDNNLRLGQRLAVPAGSKTPPSSRAASAERGASSRSAEEAPLAKGSYWVRPGDTVYSIARDQKVTVQALMAANNLKKPGDLKAGRALTVPGKGAQAAPSAGNRQESAGRATAGSGRTGNSGKPVGAAKTVTIGKGDTLYSLAKKHGVTVAALEAANGLKPGAKLKLGQNLRLP